MKTEKQATGCTKPVRFGIPARGRGTARPKRCAACCKYMICLPVGNVWLCADCRGGQGK